MPLHDMSYSRSAPLVHQEDGRHPPSATIARRIGRASDGGSERMALSMLESAKKKSAYPAAGAPTSKVRKTLDTTIDAIVPRPHG